MRAMMIRRGFAIAAVLGTGLLAAGCTTREIVGVEISAVTTFPSAASLIDGQSLQFSATVTDAEGMLLPGATVTWEIDYQSVASIDAGGMLLALNEGTATVRAVFNGVYGSASLAVLPGASIVLSEDSVAFRAVLGGRSPSPAVIQILNDGVGAVGALEASVQYAAGQPADWLTSTLAGTQAPTTLTLTPETERLPAGRYDAVVTIDSDVNGEPTLVSVSLKVAGRKVTESDDTTSVTDSGGTDSLTVVLAAEPTSDVVVDVSSVRSIHVDRVDFPLTVTLGIENQGSPSLVQDELKFRRGACRLARCVG